MSEKENKILPNEGDIEVVIFNKKEIRRILYKGEWWFSVVDIVASLTEHDRQGARNYWKTLKNRMKEEGVDELVAKCNQLKLPAEDGKTYETDCVNVEQIFRIIQSIPSRKAEPFKKWLAKTGFERLQECENPELAFKRAISDYVAKGYSDEWIKVRMQSISTRNALTKEWDKRDIQNHYNDNIKGKEYAILTNVISQNTFGISTKEHQHIKGLKSQNLRDHMTPIELIFNMLGEQATIDITKEKDAKGFHKNLETAKEGGKTAGVAREAFEQSRGVKVVSNKNFLKSKNIEIENNLENDIKQLTQPSPQRKQLKDYPTMQELTKDIKENIHNKTFEKDLEKIAFKKIKK
jgi:hypothetical protein